MFQFEAKTAPRMEFNDLNTKADKICTLNVIGTVLMRATAEDPGLGEVCVCGGGGGGGGGRPMVPLRLKCATVGE